MFPFWADGRSGSQDVYTDALNLDLFTDVDTLSAGSGGTANFTINVGPNHGGETYFLLMSGSGTTPGTPVGAVTVPLNSDVWTAFGLGAGAPFLPGYFGVLDTTGSATAALNTGGSRSTRPSPARTWTSPS